MPLWNMKKSVAAKIDEYFELQSLIHSYFDYTEDYCVIPLEDTRECFWKINGTELDGELLYSPDRFDVRDETGEHCVDEIYHQRFLSKYVYRTEHFTLIACDPHVDGNKFLRILDNEKEVKE